MAKLDACGPRELFASYRSKSQDAGVQIVGQAVGLSLQALAAYPRELPRQLFGRLGRLADPAIAALVARAQEDEDFSPAPRWPGLTPPSAERLRLVGHEDRIRSAKFSRNGAWVLTASQDASARIWNVATGEEIVALRGHEGWIFSAVFSPDGARVLTASADGTARIWDFTTGEEIRALCGHETSVFSAVFSANGARVLTASADGTARIWGAVTGEAPLILRGHTERIHSAVFSPDDTRVAATGCQSVITNG
jgi:WD40 repeat protein